MTTTVRHHAGKVAYRAGLAAEEQVAMHYTRMGRAIAARRWRGTGGEIDLIARDGAEVIFIEVKKSKTHAQAADHLTQRQILRIYSAAAEFLGGEPRGQATDVRFDVALVDQFGRIELRQNVFAA